MNLQGRFLHLADPRQRGDDVRLLHTELRQLGLEIPPEDWDAASFGEGTGRAVGKFQERFEAELRAIGWAGERGVVETVTARLINAKVDALGHPPAPVPAPPAPTNAPSGDTDGYSVEGLVFRNDAPAGGLEVVLYDRDIGEVRDRLGDADRRYLTGADGRFLIRYTVEQFARGDKDTPDLVFEVRDDRGAIDVNFVRRLPLPAAESSRFEGADVRGDDLLLGIAARRRELVEIHLVPRRDAKGLSEYRQLIDSLQPVLLERSPAELDEVRYRDITFAARESGVDRDRVADLVAAHTLAKQLADCGIQRLPELLWGLARLGHGLQVHELARARAADIAGLLTAASGERNLIDSIGDAAAIQELTERVSRCATTHMLELPLGDRALTLSRIWSRAIPDAAQRVLVARAFADHDGSATEVWQQLSQRPEFSSPERIQAAQLALHAAQLGGHRQGFLDAVLADPAIRSLRDLALAPSLAPYVANIASGELADVPGETEAEQRETLAREIKSRLEDAFPTETVVRVLRSAQPQAAATQRWALASTLLERAGSALGEQRFDIRTTHVESFVERHGERLFAGQDETQRRDAIAAAKWAQRLFNVSTSSAAFEALARADFASAQHIAEIPRDQFVCGYAGLLGDTATAELVHGRAMSIALTAAELKTQVYQSKFGARPAAIGPGIKSPKWAELFGSVELCECKDCQSILSPAAYLVDLFRFLDAPQAGRDQDGHSPLDHLLGGSGGVPLGRRPDLAHLKLSCENTNQPLPYVDLVNEVLESYVVHGQLDERAAFDSSDRNPRELLASPQFVNDKAYEVLAQAVYPPQLPFDGSLEASRLHLVRLEHSRLELLRAFLWPADDNWPATIVAESLGMSAREYEVVTGQKLDGTPGGVDVKLLFGFEANDPSIIGELISRVSVRDVLRRTATDYPELIDIVASRGFNPAQQALRSIERSGAAAYTRLLEVVGASVPVALALTPSESAALVAASPFAIPPAVQARLAGAGVTNEQLQSHVEGIARLLAALGMPVASFEAWLQAGALEPPAEVAAILANRSVTKEQFAQWMADLDGLILLESAADPCNLDETYLCLRGGLPLTAGSALYLARFVRLRRRTGWSVADLDRALVAFDFAADPAAAVQRIAQLRQLVERFGGAVSTWLGMWAPIDTAGPTSTWLSLFADRAVSPNPEPAFDLDVPQSALVRLPAPAAVTTMFDRRTTLQAALRLRDTEFTLIASYLQIVEAGGGTPGTPLTIANVSAMRRYAELARASGAPLALVIEGHRLLCATVHPLSDPPGAGDPFADPQQMLAFLDVLGALRASGITAAQLAFLGRHAGAQTLEAALKQATALQRAITDRVQSTEAELAAALQTPTAEVLRQKLGTYVPSGADLDAVLNIVEWTSNVEPEDWKARLDAILAMLLADADRQELAKPPATAPALTLEEREAQRVLRRSLVLRRVGEHARRDGIVRACTDALDLAPALATLLLAQTDVLHSVRDASRPLRDDFLPQPGGDATFQAAAMRLFKVVALANALRLRAPDLGWLTAHPALAGGFDANRIPCGDAAADALAAGETPLARARSVMAMVVAAAAWAALRDDCAADAEQMAACLAAPADAAAAKARLDAVAALLGTPTAQVAASAAALGWADARLATVDGMRSLVRLTRLANDLGGAPGELRAWCDNPTPAGARALQDLVKARFGAAAWESIARTTNDQLREAQRSSLVAHVLTLPAIRGLQLHTADQLFEHFLIDVQMDPKMLTSRVKQAISSVQLFANRILLNCDTLLQPQLIDALQWQWRKSFNVWRANRSVFVHTENMLLGELRDDKTPFFEELEAELAQVDVSEKLAERAVRSYLAKLEEVSRLETVALFADDAPPAPDRSVLHVIGRTLGGAPRRYWYRRWVDRRDWTPWERIDVEIQGSETAEGSGVQLLPVVWRRRLYLFWLTLSLKSDAPSLAPVDPNKPIPITPPQQFWEIKLSWSLHEDGKWSQKRVSNASVDYPPHELVIAGFEWVTEGNKSVHKAKYLPSADRHEGQPLGDASLYRIKAVQGGSTLELWVMRGTDVCVGRFMGLDPYGDFQAQELNPGWATRELVPLNGVSSYMAARGVGPLTLSTPGKSQVKLLAAPPQPFRFLSATQSRNAVLDGPHMLEGPRESYFGWSSAAVEWSYSYFATPNKASAKASAFEFTTVQAKASRHAVFAVPAEVPAHPWLADAIGLKGSALNTLVQRSGLSHTVPAQHMMSGGSSQMGGGAAAAPVDQLLSGAQMNSPVAKALWSGTVDKIFVPLSESLHMSFEVAFHPWAAEFTRRLNDGGLARLWSLDTQALGNTYLREPWHPGYTIASAGAVVTAALIEGGVGRVEAAGGRPGNLEILLRESAGVRWTTHDSGNVAADWVAVGAVTGNASGGVALLERMSERTTDSQGRVSPGRGEAFVVRTDGLAHFTRDPGNAAVWNFRGVVTANIGLPANAMDPLVPCAIESTARTGGKRSLELLVPEKTAQADVFELAHYRQDNANGAWTRLGVVCTDVRGSACMVQGSASGGAPGYDAVVLERNPLDRQRMRLMHYQFDATAGWQRGVVITDQATGPASLIQSRVRDCASWGNYELVVLEGRQLVHYWRDNSRLPRLWRRGQVISSTASGPACLVQSHFGLVGNFEVVVPEPGGLKHYWHPNEGWPGTSAERFYFDRAWQPTSKVSDPYPRHDVDFSPQGAYSKYNWELFFHIPMRVVEFLQRNLRLEEALRAIRAVFDATSRAPDLTSHRYWNTLPLRDAERARIDTMLALLSSERPADQQTRSEAEAQIADWQKNPFQPHRIARMRLDSYRKQVVMQYSDLLLAVGDQCFRADTIEKINEATQYYVMLAALWGPRPQIVPPRTRPVAYSFAELRSGLDAFSNALVEIENEFPFAAASLTPMTADAQSAALLGTAQSLYFCVPRNERLLSYWDAVEDRLYKIRHSMNLQGVVRTLPLFEPPLDPMMLVRAVAAGLPLADAVGGVGAALPYQRFTFSIARALEACADLKAAGTQLLAAIDRKENEELALRRASNEADLAGLVKSIRDAQVEEANANVDALLAGRAVAVAKLMHLRQLLGDENGTEPKEGEPIEDKRPSLSTKLVASEEAGLRLIQLEADEFSALHSARDWQVRAAFVEGLASLLSMFGSLEIATKPVGVGASYHWGGPNLIAGLHAWSRQIQNLSAQDSYRATVQGKSASYLRREQEWAHQHNVMARELAQIDKQLGLSRMRANIALKEQYNQQVALDHAQGVREYLKEKFGNVQLHAWMQSTCSGMYLRAYREVKELALRAQACFRWETGQLGASFIGDEDWDGARKGLLAGERLHLALRQMERAYHAQNRREFELTRSVSLASLDPLQLLALKEQGVCEFEVPELLFDLDYPSHYFRRVRSLSVSIPCVAGPYEPVSCTVRMLRHETRIRQDLAGRPYARTGDNDDRFIVSYAIADAVATSSARDDAGVFELNARDERYLPCEGAGAVARYRVELNAPWPRFDHQSITDVVLHIRYSAREAGQVFRDAAVASARQTLAALTVESKAPLMRLFSVRHEFPEQWAALTRAPVDEQAPIKREAALPVGLDRFPYFLKGAALKRGAIHAIAMLRPAEGEDTLESFKIELNPNAADAEAAFTLTMGMVNPQLKPARYGVQPAAGEEPLPALPANPKAAEWKLAWSATQAQAEAMTARLQQLFLVIEYTASLPPAVWA
ncbi:MAG: hypothetical protein J0M00_04675 [Burkholderiales bacterium]|nr:hypothetical protein [Burkholderiales bacterium]